MKKDADEFTKIYKKCNTELTNNAKLKYATSTFFDKLSYNNKSVAPKQSQLYYACRTKYADRTVQIMIDINRLLDRVKKYQKSIIHKSSSETYNLKISNILEDAIDSFVAKVYTVTKWNTDIAKYAGRTRVSLFGKRVRDSINESAADDYHKNHEERMKDFNKKMSDLDDHIKKDKEDSDKKQKETSDALKALLGESMIDEAIIDLDFLLEE